MYNYLSISTLQNLLFCIAKAAVLHGKSVGFALQKSRFRNVKSKSLQNDAYVFAVLKMLSATALIGKKKNKSLSYSF
ncbi:hypothetical protein [Prevotella intermedia]|uniref:hypothetical protein n=1 Tax=Prevotella intermedia TaxID=28131 RepID=UPI000AB33D35|nr:hypothetical protein [Prevotella intermedia]